MDHWDLTRWPVQLSPISYLVDDADGVSDVDLLIGLPQLTLPVHRLPQQQLTQVVLIKLLPPDQEAGSERERQMDKERETDRQTDREREREGLNF